MHRELKIYVLPLSSKVHKNQLFIVKLRIFALFSLDKVLKNQLYIINLEFLHCFL